MQVPGPRWNKSSGIDSTLFIAISARKERVNGNILTSLSNLMKIFDRFYHVNKGHSIEKVRTIVYYQMNCGPTRGNDNGCKVKRIWAL